MHVTILNEAIHLGKLMIRTCSSVVKHFQPGVLLRHPHFSSARNQVQPTLPMSVQQPPWSVPKRQSEEPVLRIYNSLTKTKVSLKFCQPYRERSHMIYRQSLSHVMVVMSNGTTVVPQFMMLHIWDMQGRNFTA